jgi:putative hemolysin
MNNEKGFATTMKSSVHLIAAAGIAAGIGFSAGPAEANSRVPEGAATGLPNPAAVFCVERGGRYEIRKTAGGETGVCILPDGTEADAWTYFREMSQQPKRD